MPAQMDAFAKAFVSALPHARALGITLRSSGPAVAEVEMPYDPKLIGDPRTKVVHGGAVSALMDTCCGVSVFMHPEAAGSTATIDLRIDYMRAAIPGQTILASAECFHVTRSVAFVRAKAFDDDRENPVATATGAFTFTRKEKST